VRIELISIETECAQGDGFEKNASFFTMSCLYARYAFGVYANEQCKAAAGPNEDFSFKSFIPGKDAFEKHNLKIGVEYQDTYHTMSIEGDIDLDGDNHADSLLCDIVSNEDSSIHINDSALTLFVNYIDSPSDLQIIDIDRNDSYKEIVILESGLEALYPGFIRYTGSEIIHLGHLNGEFYVDGHGRVMTDKNVTLLTEPEICSGFYEVVNQQFVFKPLDIDRLENKYYTIRQDTEVYFIESGDAPGSFEPEYIWNMDMISLKKGERIKVNRIGVSPISGELIWLNITLDDHRTGNLYLSILS
jgi:hypothetical protein